ncbi:MAG: ABC transporter permease subunit [bacterium]|nr:ABC transporter permease subunit [bacterium]MCP4967331.1 ABC transporter permease subunit [bacterium]
MSQLRRLVVIIPVLLFVGVGLLIPLSLVLIGALEATSTDRSAFDVVQSPPVPAVLGRTLVTAALVSAIALPLAFAIAHALRRVSPWVRSTASAVFILPLVLNLLVIILAWLLILEKNGLIGWVLRATTGDDDPPSFLFNPIASYLAMLYAIVPVMVLLIAYDLGRQHPSTREAAQLLGVSPWHVLLRIDIGQALPALISSYAIGYVIALNLYLVPEFLTGPQLTMLPFLVQQSVLNAFDLRTAAAISLLLATLSLVPLSALVWAENRQRS